jgi:hypothetical protein
MATVTVIREGKGREEKRREGSGYQYIIAPHSKHMCYFA